MQTPHSARIAVALRFIVLGIAIAGEPALAQRAASYDKRVKDYIVHDARTIRIDDVRVIDGTGAAAKEGQSILIRDGTIARIAPREQLSGEAADTMIDGKGRTVTPGLVMMHEHLFFLDVFGEAPNYGSEPFAAPKAYLAWGATTIRTAGTMHGTDDLQAARMIREGKFLGPDIRVTAPFVNGPGSFAFQLRPIDNPADARRIVSFWADEGATSFKIYQNISREVLAAAIDEAHGRHLKVTGHLCSITLREAAEMGIDNLEHGIAVASDFVRDKTPDLCPARDTPEKALLAAAPDGPEMKALIDTLVRHKVAVTSTLAVFAAGVIDGYPAPDDLLMLNHESQTSALRWLAHYRGAPERREMWRGVVRAEMRFERDLVAAGGLLMAGTDPTGWAGRCRARATARRCASSSRRDSRRSRYCASRPSTARATRASTIASEASPRASRRTSSSWTASPTKTCGSSRASTSSSGTASPTTRRRSSRA